MSEAGGKALFHAVVAFAGDRGKSTQGCQQCGCGVLKQQIPKFMGNGGISTLPPGTYSLRGDMQFNCWFSHDVTKIQTKKLSILPRFYFHDALEQLKTNFHINFRFQRVLGFVIEDA